VIIYFDQSRILSSFVIYLPSMSLKRLLNPDDGTDAGDARAQNRSFSQERRLENAEFETS
jgi:hypothetical protein